MGFFQMRCGAMRFEWRDGRVLEGWGTGWERGSSVYWGVYEWVCVL